MVSDLPCERLVLARVLLGDALWEYIDNHCREVEGVDWLEHAQATLIEGTDSEDPLQIRDCPTLLYLMSGPWRAKFDSSLDAATFALIDVLKDPCKWQDQPAGIGGDSVAGVIEASASLLTMLGLPEAAALRALCVDNQDVSSHGTFAPPTERVVRRPGPQRIQGPRRNIARMVVTAGGRGASMTVGKIRRLITPLATGGLSRTEIKKRIGQIKTAMNYLQDLIDSLPEDKVPTGLVRQLDRLAHVLESLERLLGVDTTTTTTTPPGHDHEQRIITYLRDHPNGADDDQLSDRLNIRPRQTVNKVCHALAKAGRVAREKGSSGKIVNRFLR